jgi:ATP-binding cassette subfamily B protein
VRARIALVPQDSRMFATSARENIRFGRPDASDAEVERAADLAHADEFIRVCRKASTRNSASAA